MNYAMLPIHDQPILTNISQRGYSLAYEAQVQKSLQETAPSHDWRNRLSMSTFDGNRVSGH